MSVDPVQPVLKEGGYGSEVSSFGDINNLFKFFATKKLRASLSSPPLAHQVGELEFVYDKTQQRLYTKIDGTLRYVAFT